MTKWIPISEREPDTAAHVLVTLDCGDGNYEVAEMDYGVAKYFKENLEQVIAWMPLPKPYTTEQIEKECLFCKYLEKGDTLYESNSWDGGISYDYVEINYCPICGRELPGEER